MHEHGVVKQLIETIRRDIPPSAATRIRQVHVRRGSTFARESLVMAFEMLSVDTPLEGAELVIEDYDVTHTCASCGHSQRVTSDDLLGHLFICPECGFSVEIDEAHGIELLKVTT